MKRWMLAVAVALFAVPAVTWADGAIVISDEGCTVPDADGNMWFADGAKYKAVKNGQWIIMTCHAELPSGQARPASAVRLNGETNGGACHTPFGSTLHWRAVVTPGGQVSMVCKYARVPNG